jgi:hypothetical protein
MPPCHHHRFILSSATWQFLDQLASAQLDALGMREVIRPTAVSPDGTSEPGLRSTGRIDAMAARAAPVGMGAGAADEPISVNPEEVTIHAALEVAYSIPQDDSPSSG